MIKKELFPAYFLMQISTELIMMMEDSTKIVRKKAFNSIQDCFEKIFILYGISTLESEEDYHDELIDL